MCNNFQKTALTCFCHRVHARCWCCREGICVHLTESHKEPATCYGELLYTEHWPFVFFLFLGLSAFRDWAELLSFSLTLWFLFLARISFLVLGFFSTQRGKLNDMGCWLFDLAGFAYKPLICQGNSGLGEQKRPKSSAWGLINSQIWCRQQDLDLRGIECIYSIDMGMVWGMPQGEKSVLPSVAAI